MVVSFLRVQFKSEHLRENEKKLSFWCTFQFFFGGDEGQRTGVGVTTVSNSLTLGGWVTKVLKNCHKKWGGGGVKGWVTTICWRFLCHWHDKNATIKKLHFGQFFRFVFVKFRNSCSKPSKALSPGQKQNSFRSFGWFKSVLLISINVLQFIENLRMTL